jgi:HAE1 family hydrophobic/amphiphilic exporter-1
MKKETKMDEKQNVFGKISDYFINKYRSVYLILLVVFIFGYSAYDGLAREEMPESSMPFGMISVQYDGVAPEDMESLVTDVIEEAVSDIDGLDEITSTTSLGSSRVMVSFDEDTDMDDAEADLNSAVDDIQNDLPEDASDPLVMTANTVDRPIMEFSISGDYDLSELKTYAEELYSKIENVDGVSEVTLTGGLDREINVYIDEEKLDMYGLTLASVASDIDSYNSDYPTPSADLDTLEYSITFNTGIEDLEDIEGIIVGSVDGFPLYLGDIGSVVDEYADVDSVSRRYDAELQDEEIMVPVISISIQRESGANIIQISDDVKEILSDGQGTIYPEDVNIVITNEDSVKVEAALSDVMSNALSGLLLVIVVLFIFIGFKESIIVAFVIPVSLLMSFICMSLMGVTLNTMSMVALILALGMLVDNAIVIMENIDRTRDQGTDIITSSKVATNQVAPAVFAATLTTISAFVPLAFMSGGIGEFMKSIPYVVIFAITSSFLVSIVITPTLCSRLLSKYKEEKKMNIIAKTISVLLVMGLSMYAFYGSAVMYMAMIIFGLAMFYKMFIYKKGTGSGKLISLYGKFIEKLISRIPGMIALVLACILIFAFSISRILTGALQIELMPTEDSTSLEISAEMPVGYLIEDTLEIAGQIEDRLYKYPEILNVVSKINSDEASVSVEIVDEDYRDMTSSQLMDVIRSDVSDIVGANITVGQQTRGYQGSDHSIMLELLSDDSSTLKEVSADLMEILSTVEGTTEVSSSLTDGPPELRIDIDEEKANMYGISVASIANTISQKISGLNASQIVLDGEEVEIYVNYADEGITSISDFNNISFESSDGTTIYFSQLAQVTDTEGVDSISHQDLERIETVYCELLDGYNSTEVTAAFEAKVDNYNLPSSVTTQFSGDRMDIQESFTSLAYSMILAIIMVFIILCIQFNSLLQPFIILFAVPLATIGAIWGLIITGNNFGVYAFFGIVSLVGIAINDAIVLIDYINYLRFEGGKDIKKAIVEGGMTRFIPVFSTTITTIGGILPLAMRDSSYAQLGYSLIFGLLVSTVLTLIVIPVLYLAFENAKTRFKRVVPIFIDERQGTDNKKNRGEFSI